MILGRLLGLLALVLTFIILWRIRQILLLLFAAIVLATALNQLVRGLQRSQLNRLAAMLLSVSFLLLFFVGLFWLIVPPFADQFQQLLELMPQGIDRLDIGVSTLQSRLPNWARQNLPEIDELVRQLQPLANRLINQSLAFFSNSLNVLLEVLLVLVLTLMLLANPEAYRQAVIRLFPSFYRTRADEILDQCEIALGGWLVGILFNMTVIAFLSCVGLWVLRVPLALAHGVLAGLLTFIPNLGPAVSVVPPVAIALIDAPWKAIAVLILYIFIQQLESNLLTPYVMAQQVALLPAVTLSAQVVFATFFGFLGLLLALPLTVVSQVWIREVLVKDVLDRWSSRPPQPKSIP